MKPHRAAHKNKSDPKSPDSPKANTKTTRRVVQIRRRTAILVGFLVVSLVLLIGQREYLSVFPNSRARGALRQRDLPGAQYWLRISERIAPGNAEKEFLLARVCRREGDFEGMRQHLRKSLQAGFPADTIQREEWLALAQSGKIQEAESYLGALTNEPRGDAPEICEAYVIGYLRNYRLQKAFELLAVWEADFPRDPQPFFWRGQIRQEQRAWSEAAREFQETLRRDPHHTQAALDLADALIELKRPEDALRFYDLAAAQADGGAPAQLGRAKSLKMLGRKDEARQTLEALVRQDPNHAAAAVELAQLESAAGRHARALELLEPLESREPKNLDLQYAYAVALRGTKQLDEAKKRFDAVTKIREERHRASDLVMQAAQQPDNADLRCEIGTIYLHYGDEKTGLVWLANALECDPRHRETHRVLADYYASHSEDDPRYQTLAQNHRRLSRE